MTIEKYRANILTMRIINRLKEIQIAEGLSDEAFARKIGISRVHWNNIKHGKSPIGIHFLNKVKKAYPGLKKDVEFFLLNEFGNEK